MNNGLTLNYEWITNNSMIVTDYGEGIWSLENFLTPEISNSLTAYADSLTEDRGRESFRDHMHGVAETLYGDRDIIHLIGMNKINDLDDIFRNYLISYDKAARILDFEFSPGLEERWANIFKADSELNQSRFEIDGPGFIERRYVNTGTRLHQDHDTEGSLLYATILYVNDNFEGGELCFPERDIVMQPKAGTLYIFDASYNYQHEVKTITKGTRYSMPIFAGDLTKDDTFRKLYK